MNPKELRELARTLLNLADAIYEKRVYELDSPYAFHYSPKRYLGGMVLGSDDSDKTLIQEIPFATCKHDFTKWAFFIVGAYCRLTNSFFINPKETKLLIEKMCYFSRP